MNDEETVKNFCADHSINILDTNKRANRYSRIVPNYFQFKDDYNKVFEKIEYTTEPVYTIEILESELIRIANFEAQVFNNLKKTGHYNMFEYMMEQKEKEKYLKDKYPSVKKAYENYSLMLKLAESGEL